jgi:hypothetical protein
MPSNAANPICSRVCSAKPVVKSGAKWKTASAIRSARSEPDPGHAGGQDRHWQRKNRRLVVEQEWRPQEQSRYQNGTCKKARAPAPIHVEEDRASR